MDAYRALIECGAKPSEWDRSGMRPVHVAALCGNLEAVRDLIAMDGPQATLDRKKAMELYTVREKFIKQHEQYDMAQGGDDDDDHDPHDQSEPLGDDAAMTMMDDNNDILDDDDGSGGVPWGFDSSANPNSSRDFYRSLTADLGDFDMDENAGSETGLPLSDPENMLGLGDGDLDDDDDDDIGASDDDDTTLPDLLDITHDDDEEMPDAEEEKQNSDDAKIAAELMALLSGSLKSALARAERRRKASAHSTHTPRPETNGAPRPDEENTGPNGSVTEPPTSLNAPLSPRDGQTRIVRASDGSETHIVRMGDVVRVHMPNGTVEEGDDESEGNQLYLQVLAAVFKALNDYQKEFYGANLLHLAARQKQHDVMRLLLESCPHAQQISDRQNDGLTALHVAAEVNDPIAINLLLASGSNINEKCDTQSTTALMVAAKKGLVEAVKCLIEKGARVEEEDDEGRTALHFVAESEGGSEEIVKMLVEKGMNVNAQTIEGSTPVYIAVANGNTKIFKKLLELGGDPSISNYDGSVPLGFIATRDMKELATFAEFVSKNPAIKEKMDMDIQIGDQGQTALHMASVAGSPNAVKALVDAGADCNKLNEYGNSALMMVARTEDMESNARFECMKHLVNAGADVKVAGEEGKQAIHFVTFLGEPECVELLLKNGADPSAVTNVKTPLHLVALENIPEIAEILLKYGAKINALDNMAMTPLMYASLKHSVEVLQVLIQAGADLTQKAEGGMTALHIAAVTADARAEDTVRLLCEAGAPMDVKDEHGMCPIHLHGDFERTRCVRRLLMCGCDPNLRCDSGFTPLIRACNARSSIDDNLTLVRVLLRAGADVNAKNDNDNTVMSYLGDREDLDLIRVMLAAGANINVRDKQGDTPLHEAAMGNHAKTVALLVRRGADVNARNEEMQTPLFLAAQRGFQDVVKALLGKGVNADISIPDKGGVTPYDAARDKGNDAIASMLLDATGLRLSQFAPLIKYEPASENIHNNSSSNSGTNSNSNSDQTGQGSGALRRHDSGRTICVTCQEVIRYGEEVRILPCSHVFHDPCILPWVGGEKMTNNRTCPICKQLVAPANLFPSSNGNAGSGNDNINMNDVDAM